VLTESLTKGLQYTKEDIEASQDLVLLANIGEDEELNIEDFDRLGNFTVSFPQSVLSLILVVCSTQ
jgi:hypothetical protein